MCLKGTGIREEEKREEEEKEEGGEGAGGHSIHAGKRQGHGIHLTRVWCEAGTVSGQDPLALPDMSLFTR